VGAPAVARQRRPGLVRGLVLAVSVLVGALLALPQPAAAADGGTVYVLHGLTGKVYDVFVDGKNVCPAAAAKTVVGPLSLGAGKHLVELRDGSTVAARANFTVSNGSSTDLIAHPLADATSAPQITAFRNDLAGVGPGKARLAVAHTASAPPADIRVDGKVLFSNVANGEGLTLVVPAKTYSVDIVPTASSGDPILGPVSLPVKAGTLTRVFAIGSVSQKSMDAVVHVIPIGRSGSGVPNRVATGDGGQAATSFVTGASPLPWVAVALLAAGGLLGLLWNRRPKPRPVPVRRTRRR
jgi:hypothetical protein